MLNAELKQGVDRALLKILLAKGDRQYLPTDLFSCYFYINGSISCRNFNQADKTSGLEVIPF